LNHILLSYAPLQVSAKAVPADLDLSDMATVCSKRVMGSNLPTLYLVAFNNPFKPKEWLRFDELTDDVKRQALADPDTAYTQGGAPKDPKGWRQTFDLRSTLSSCDRSCPYPT